MIRVTIVAQTRNRQPINRSNPSMISAKGNVCATKETPVWESKLYDSTWTAKFERLVDSEKRRAKNGQKIKLGRKSLQQPAETKIPPRTRRPIKIMERRTLNGLV